jgi:hypothetical protein
MTAVQRYADKKEGMKFKRDREGWTSRKELRKFFKMKNEMLRT